MAQPTVTTAFVEKVPRTPGTASFRFARPTGYTHTAGQWFVLTIPSPGGPLTKHFTHSDSPTEDYLEFTTRLTGSEYKNAVDGLTPGTEVQIEGPYGAFTLRPGLERVVFLTGGIGITPVRSILRSLADSGSLEAASPAGAEHGSSPADGAPLEIVVFYGNLDEGSITFGDELDDLARPGAPLKLVHVLSSPSEAWEGHRGYISREIVEAELDDPSAWTHYVSGPPAMVEAMRALLVDLGLTRRQMVLENFEGYA